MRLEGTCVGFGITASHCSFDEVFPHIERLRAEGAEVIAVRSFTAASTDTRFGTADAWRERLHALTGRAPVETIPEAEPLGQKRTFDAFVIAPCTGNTLAKLAGALTDTPVLMAAKGTLRNLRPVVLAISTNDALGNNARNIGILLNAKNIYFVPFGQDNPEAKPTSCVADFDLITETVVASLEGRQLQPILIERGRRAVR
ncbi:dipicolinate synthase subunit B [Limnochorda pilosa]|uniref:Dipicolinate synthase subunit B n=1 Tax=Limnochorda pilosa TaxID=1555112 RepID=A0A0K2SN17_LIMPI|nr:dipicolinate synthase subunit B [Limnochorda pilosa]BAS28397.1 dipicolinate synthase subunit B [Limnochorda pilosa]